MLNDPRIWGTHLKRREVVMITGMLCFCYTIKSFYGNSQYQYLPQVIKFGLAFTSTNAESKRSLLINAIVVSSESSALGEVTITGLHTVKEAVRFYDPVNGQPENIAITKELKRSVRLAHTTYQA